MCVCWSTQACVGVSQWACAYVHSFLRVHKCGEKELDKDQAIFRAFIIVTNKRNLLKIIGQTFYFKPNNCFFSVAIKEI